MSYEDAAFLENEFPHLYVDVPSPGCIPFSAILTECSAQSSGEYVHMEGVLRHFDIPSFAWGYGGDNDLGTVVPKEWRANARRLYKKGLGYDLLQVKKKLGFVEWNSERHLVVEVSEPYENGEWELFRIAPARFFDFEK